MLNAWEVDTTLINRQRRYSYTVTFPKVTDSSRITVLAAALRQEEFKHDILKVKIKNQLTGTNRIEAGDPVKFEWTMQGITTTWIGYVYLVDPSTKPSRNINTIVCIGNSYHMKNSRQSVYTNCTANVVASRVAKYYGLKTNISSHPLVFKQIAQSGQSDWQLLSRLARQCGFGFRVDNNKLVFRNREELYNQNKRLAFRFQYHQSPMGAMTPFMGVLDFELHMSEQAPDVEGAGVKRKISTLSKSNNTVQSTEHERKHVSYNLNSPNVSRHVRGNSKATFTKIVTDEVTPTTQYAKTVLKSITDTQRYRYRAKAALVGNATIKPYSVVYLEGVPDGTHGYWTVLSVTHRFGESKSYYMEVLLGTDTLAEPFVNASTSNTRDVVGELAGEVPSVGSNTYVLDSSNTITAIQSDLSTAQVVSSTGVPYGTDMYNYMVPDFSEYASTSKWRVM